MNRCLALFLCGCLVAGRARAVSPATSFYLVGRSPQSQAYATVDSWRAAHGFVNGHRSVVSDADDSPLEEQTLPFLFPFFGRARQSVLVAPNGALMLGSGPPCGCCFLGYSCTFNTSYAELIAVSLTDHDPAQFDQSTVRVYNTSTAFGVVWDSVAMFGTQSPFATFGVTIRPDGRITFHYWKVFDPKDNPGLQSYSRMRWLVGVRPMAALSNLMGTMNAQSEWSNPRELLANADAGGLDALMKSWWTSTPGAYIARTYVRNLTHWETCPLPSASRITPYSAGLGARPCVNVSLVPAALATPSGAPQIELHAPRSSSLLACRRAGLPAFCRFRVASGAITSLIDTALDEVAGASDADSDDTARCTLPSTLALADGAALAALLAAGDLAVIYVFEDGASVPAASDGSLPLREKSLNLTLTGGATINSGVGPNGGGAAPLVDPLADAGQCPAFALGACARRDCAGVCGGDAVLDRGGNCCARRGAKSPFPQLDCFGTCYGTALVSLRTEDSAGRRYNSLVCCARASIDSAGQCCYGGVDCAGVCRGASRLCCGACTAPPIGFCPSATRTSQCDPSNPAAAPTYTLYPTRYPTPPTGGGGGIEPAAKPSNTASTTSALAAPIMLLGVIAFLLATISLVLMGLVVFLVGYRLKTGHHWGADAAQIEAAAAAAAGLAPPSLTPGRALTAEEIDRYSTKAVFAPPAIAPADGEEEICSVCICEFEAGEELRTLRCGHAYHTECIDEWLLSLSVLCPMCKQDVRRGRCLTGAGDELAVEVAAAAQAAAAAAEEGVADAAAQTRHAERPGGAGEEGEEDEAARPADGIAPHRGIDRHNPHHPQHPHGRVLQREFSGIEGVEGIEGGFLFTVTF